MPIKFQNTIFIRIFFLFGFLVLTSGIVFSLLIIPMQKSAFQQIMFTQSETISKSIVMACSDAIVNKDYSFIVEYINAVIKNNSSIHYIILSPKDGDKIWIGHGQWKLIDKIPDVVQESQEITSKIITDHNKKVFYFIYPIQFSGIYWGWLHIGFSTEQYDDYINSMYFNIMYITGIPSIFMLFAGYLFSRWISDPIKMISQLATKVASGNLTVRSKIMRNDEIGMLSDSFNQMINSLTLSKSRLENYNQELELQVANRVQELDELNKDLDKKINMEIAKNQKQEALIIQQSRLAAMGEMIGAIAHQWRQPLNALGLVHQNLYLMYKSGRLDDDFMLHSMEKSERLVKKMSSTIDDFRNFFKPNKHIESFNIKSTIVSTVELIEEQLKNNNINLTMNCENDLIVKGFQGELSQVILNLLNNAKDILLERKPDYPQITIKTTLNTNGKIRIVVKDNGGGIHESIIDNIYDPYFTTKEEGKGTGIGLYMSKVIIENNMGGSLNAFNDTEGANFVIEL